MARTFGEMVDEGVRQKGWSDYQLSAAIGLLPGEKAFNATQVRRLRRGERRNVTHDLVAKLIELLDLDPAEAWHAAGLWPPGLEPEDLPNLSELAAARGKAAQRVAREGATAAASPDQRKPTTAYFGVLQEDEEEAAA
jgi:transcriptional regulator with XRE-family HTH domain